MAETILAGEVNYRGIPFYTAPESNTSTIIFGRHESFRDAELSKINAFLVRCHGMDRDTHVNLLLNDTTQGKGHQLKDTVHPCHS